MSTERCALRIERFDPDHHDRAAFTCGVGRLDHFLKLNARKQQKNDLTRVYVAVKDGATVVLGYYAINVGMMNVDELDKRPRGAPRHGEIPVLFLGQVAVSESAQGQGIGSTLMHHVFLKAQNISTEAGCHAIVLDVMSDGDEAAFRKRVQWYAAFGFSPFASMPARMFMTMSQVRGVL